MHGWWPAAGHPGGGSGRPLVSPGAAKLLLGQARPRMSGEGPRQGALPGEVSDSRSGLCLDNVSSSEAQSVQKHG